MSLCVQLFLFIFRIIVLPTQTSIVTHALNSRCYFSCFSLREPTNARSAAENLSYLDEIPASPAPYKERQSTTTTSTRQPQAAAGQSSSSNVPPMVSNTTAVSSTRSTMNPPPVPHTQSQHHTQQGVSVSASQRAPPLQYQSSTPTAGRSTRGAGGSMHQPLSTHQSMYQQQAAGPSQQPPYSSQNSMATASKSC